MASVTYCPAASAQQPCLTPQSRRQIAASCNLRLTSNVRPHEIQGCESMKLPRALSEAGLNTSLAVNPLRGRASSSVSQAASARAARPLAVSARSRWLDAGKHSAAVPSLVAHGVESSVCNRGNLRSRQAEPSVVLRGPVPSVGHRGVTEVSGLAVSKQPWFSSALRSCVAPGAAGRAATSFARGGGFGLFSSSATQRTIRAGRVSRGARPNPSIERDAQRLAPLVAPHVKR